MLESFNLIIPLSSVPALPFRLGSMLQNLTLNHRCPTACFGLPRQIEEFPHKSEIRHIFGCSIMRPRRPPHN